ncbi:hypothetical protein LguiB_028313 [Lonicera macranthoides]
MERISPWSSWNKVYELKQLSRKKMKLLFATMILVSMLLFSSLFQTSVAYPKGNTLDLRRCPTAVGSKPGQPSSNNNKLRIKEQDIGHQMLAYTCTD